MLRSAASCTSASVPVCDGRRRGKRTYNNVACVTCECGCIAAEGSHYVQSADPVIGCVSVCSCVYVRCVCVSLLRLVAETRIREISALLAHFIQDWVALKCDMRYHEDFFCGVCGRQTGQTSGAAKFQDLFNLVPSYLSQQSLQTETKRDCTL